MTSCKHWKRGKAAASEAHLAVGPDGKEMAKQTVFLIDSSTPMFFSRERLSEGFFKKKEV